MSVQLHTYVIGCLERWAVWCLWQADLLTPKPGPRPMKSWWHVIVTKRKLGQGIGAAVIEIAAGQRAPCPVDPVEAGVTDLCVDQLPLKLRNAVIMGFLQGGTAEEKAFELGCDRSTYFRRLERAYGELLGLMNDHEAGLNRVDVTAANAEMAVRNALPQNGVLTECDSGPRMRATLV